MAKRKTRSRRRLSIQAQLVALRREMSAIRQIVQANNAALEAFDKLTTTNFRRIAELQAEIDRVKKLLAVA